MRLDVSCNAAASTFALMQVGSRLQDLPKGTLATEQTCADRVLVPPTCLYVVVHVLLPLCCCRSLSMRCTQTVSARKSASTATAAHALSASTRTTLRSCAGSAAQPAARSPSHQPAAALPQCQAAAAAKLLGSVPLLVLLCLWSQEQLRAASTAGLSHPCCR